MPINLPMVLTWARIAMIPMILGVFYLPDALLAPQWKNVTACALFTAAVDEYIQHHREDDVTRKLNEVYAKEDSSLDPVFARLQSLSFPKGEW